MNTLAGILLTVFLATGMAASEKVANGPRMQVSPERVVFEFRQDDPLPAPVQLHIRNIGDGTLEWNIVTSGICWFGIDPVSGSGNDGTAEIAITTTTLFPGEYHQSLFFHSNAGNSPIAIDVCCMVTERRLRHVRGTVSIHGAPLDQIDVVATGESRLTRRTDASGGFAFDLLEGNWTVAPRSAYFAFSPPQRDDPRLRDDSFAADFSAEPVEAWVWLHHREGWNLLSIPIEMENEEMARTLPYVVPPAYVFDPDSGYVPRTRIRGGVAYWMRFSRTDSVRLFGKLFRDVGIPADTRNAGWSMACVPSGDVDIGVIRQTQPGRLVHVYEYDPASGYREPNANLLRAGRAYFIKTSRDGVLLRAMEPAAEAQRGRD